MKPLNVCFTSRNLPVDLLTQDDKVFSYFQHKLEENYPKQISEVFPGIPDHLEAAVECPHPECEEDSVIFFKGEICTFTPRAGF